MYHIVHSILLILLFIIQFMLQKITRTHNVAFFLGLTTSNEEFCQLLACVFFLDRV